jgi:hypothetical protein
MSALTLYAGPVARERILQEGIRPEQFKVLVGASGGPKWFVLYGLDRFLFGDFFKGRTSPLLTIGSSAGAWRLCCLATADPLAAIDQLARRYSRESYSDAPTTAEITDKMRAMLNDVIGQRGIAEIVHNPVFCTHIVADRCKGLGNASSLALRRVFLGGSALANAFSRSALSWFFQRTVFSSLGEECPWHAPDKLDTRVVALTENNGLDALLSSGSIPFVLDGVRDISGGPPGLYLDGGIIDYHFDFRFATDDELVLYPHFSPAVIPGWFDKFLPWRKINPDNFNNVLFLVPSADFVGSLPHGKIPDRNDFAKFPVHERLANWETVLQKSSILAAEFAELVEGVVSPDRLRPLQELRRQG